MLALQAGRSGQASSAAGLQSRTQEACCDLRAGRRHEPKGNWFHFKCPNSSLILQQVRGRPTSTVDILDVPYSASCGVQVRARTAYVGAHVARRTSHVTRHTFHVIGSCTHPAGRHRPFPAVGLEISYNFRFSFSGAERNGSLAAGR
jgi:hypothetical protein